MIKNIKRLVARRFGHAAHSYDSAAALQDEVGGRLLGLIRNATGAQEIPKRILELGCGTGRFTALLAHEFEGAEILASDLSPGMLAATKDRFAHHPQIKTICLDADKLAETDLTGPYDLVCSNMAAQWFEDFHASLQRQTHFLTPSGILAHSTLAQGTFREWREACNDAGFNAATPDYHTLDEIESFTPEGREVTWHHFTTQQVFDSGMDFLKYLRNIGARASDRSPVSQRQLKQACRNFEDNANAVLTYEVSCCIIK